MERPEITLVQEVHSLCNLHGDAQLIAESPFRLATRRVVLEEDLGERLMASQLSDDAVAFLTGLALLGVVGNGALEGSHESEKTGVRQLQPAYSLVEAKLPLERVKCGLAVLLQGNLSLEIVRQMHA